MSSEGGSDHIRLYRRPPGYDGAAFPNWLAITHITFLRNFPPRNQQHALDRNRRGLVIRT